MSDTARSGDNRKAHKDNGETGGSSGRWSSMEHVLPPEESVPDEEPPPYTAVAEPGMSVMSNLPPGLQGQTSHAPPPGPPPRPPRPQQQSSPGLAYSYRPPNTIHSSNYSPRPAPVSSSRPSTGPSASSRVPFEYPPGYYCYKCNNTGIKLKNGKTCQDCYARFARQSSFVQARAPPVMYTPFGSMMPAFSPTPMMAPGRVVHPGDPAIGGILCGRCRGRGLIYDFIFEETCPTCRGIGRLL
jgi:hypothetical protein